MNLRSSAWQWAAMGVLVFGVPSLACGGRLLGSGSGNGTEGLAAENDKATAGTAPPALSDFPCTAYTAWHFGCPFVPGTSGCQVAQPVGGDPNKGGWANVPGEMNTAGCPLEIVPPTSTGGTTCDHVYCVCDERGNWVADPAHPGTLAGLCPPRL
jgi:hypothetical protein